MKITMRYVFVISALLLSIYGKSQACLNYSTFFGKVFQDEIKGVCTDPQHNVYVIGNTYNADLPVTAGAFQMTPKGSYEAFLAKFDSCGSLKWCTYFGTSGFDSGEKITYSNDNTIVFCGHTDGMDLDTTSGCFQTKNKGSNDCFLAKFSLSGSPIWITYFGSGGGDFAYDVKTDSLNNIVIGGTSISNGLYTNTASFQQTNSGATDAFIARFNSAGNLRFSTFYGGTNSEDIHALAIDKNCNIIGVGGSYSFNLNMSVGCYQSVSNGGMEVYVIKLDSTGQRIFSTYVGDAGTDDAYGVCTDNANYIYVSGHTNSNAFYTSPGAYQTSKAGQNDGYCLSLSPIGNMVWSTYIGGSANDFMSRMHMNQNQELVLLMSSQSSNFPMMGVGTNTANNGGADNIIIKFLRNGTPFWSTYIGGTTAETPHDLASFTKNKIVLVGATSSSDYPLSGSVYQNSFNGSEDGFVTCYSVSSSTLASINEYGVKACKTIALYNNLDYKIVMNSDCVEGKEFQIINAIGKIILTGRIGAQAIDVSNLENGFYVLRIVEISKNRSEQIKFLK